MSTQPEALRLADEVGAQVFFSREAVAAELRRLHEVNTELLHWLKYIQAQTHLGHIHDTASIAIAKATGETK
jgi:hypothetical protein